MSILETAALIALGLSLMLALWSTVWALLNIAESLKILADAARHAATRTWK